MERNATLLPKNFLQDAWLLEKSWEENPRRTEFIIYYAHPVHRREPGAVVTSTGHEVCFLGAKSQLCYHLEQMVNVSSPLKLEVVVLQVKEKPGGANEETSF